MPVPVFPSGADEGMTKQKGSWVRQPTTAKPWGKCGKEKVEHDPVALTYFWRGEASWAE
jgi:hypothetical protein